MRVWLKARGFGRDVNVTLPINVTREVNAIYYDKLVVGGDYG